MIVRSLRATGFMRYQELDLQDLPDGVIALEGDNESGKTTLGEAVAFALFGRTIRTEDTDPTQAINWDVDECETRIEFEVPEKGRFVVERTVRRTGEFEATLSGPEGTIAEGPKPVTEALCGIVGFDFPTFRYSFYVAQGELDLVRREGRDNAQRIVHDMLGITTIERAKTLLETELSELRERASTFERDLIVATALHTDALPLKAELERLEGEHVRCSETLTQAEEDAKQALAESQRSDAAQAAYRERTGALGRLERALVADTQRQALLRARAKLRAYSSRTDDLLGQAEAAIKLDAGPREQAKQDLERAEAVNIHAKRLLALVQHHGSELSKETADSADGITAREAREQAVIAREKRSALIKTLSAVLFLVIGIAGVAGALALHYPADAPKLSLPAGNTIQAPKLGLQLTNVTVRKATYALGGVGGLGLILGVLFIVLRQKTSARRQEADAEFARLDAHLAAAKAEQAACEKFELPALKDLERALAPIKDAHVKAAFDELKEKAGPLISEDSTAEQIHAAAKARHEELEASFRKAEPRVQEARRLHTTAEGALRRAEAAITVAFPAGAPEESGSQPDVPQEPEALAEALDEASADAARARVELEALLGSGDESDVQTATSDLNGALERAFEASTAPQRRAQYDEASGLAELLKEREVLPSSDDLRAVLKRERELLDELLGSEVEIREAARLAEEELREARVRRGEAQANLDEVIARSERAQAGRQKLVELERKIGELRRVLEPTVRKVAVHEEAIDQLGDLTEVMKARFGPGIARYIELVLPRLTEGRYERVKITPGLEIRVYSRERGDYIRLTDLSLGTADQLLVALRLGLARALVASRGLAGGHFLFLDEPLVSADEGREQSFLNLLRTFDDEFAQIFVSSPRPLPSEGPFTARLQVARAEPTVVFA